MNIQFGNDLFAGLNEQQAAAVRHTEGAVLVLAGAGSGKTRVLTHRIAHIVQERLARPWQVLAVTFTNKAAGELRQRASAIVDGGDEVAAGTFHSLMLRVLRRDAAVLGYPRDFSIFDSDDSQRLVKQILKEYNEDSFRPRSIHSIVSRLKNDLVDPESYAASARMPLEKTAAAVYPEYQKRLKTLGAMDFDDLITLPIRLFREHPAILAHWTGRWRYLHVDEMQDTNHAQFELLRLLGGPKPNLFAVGDDDQSIYGWRGARVDNIFQFKDTFEGATIYRLEQNYRSTQKILDLANAVVAKSVRREEKVLWTERTGGGTPDVVEATSDLEEAREVLDRINRAVMSGRRAYREFAILYRTNAQSRSFEDALRANRVPYQLLGGVGFYSRKEIRDALSYFKLCLNPKDDLALRRIIAEPPRGIGATTLNRLQGHASANDLSLFEAMSEARKVEGLGTRALKQCSAFSEQVLQWQGSIDSKPLEAWAKDVLEESGYLQRLREEQDFEAQGRLDNLDSLVDSLAEHAAGDGTLPEYLEQAALATDQDKYDPGADSVRLMTIHAAKGLEFPVVIVTGLEEGTFPLRNPESDDEHDLDEERRLFYVAVTRATDELILTYARSRRTWGQLTDKDPSTFLLDLPGESVSWERNVRASAGLSGLDAARGFRQQKRAGGRSSRPARSTANLPPLAQSYGGAVAQDAGATGGSEDIPAIRTGDLVRHGTYGAGIVVKVESYKDSQRVEVEFDSGETKTMVQKFAKLQPVKDL